MEHCDLHPGKEKEIFCKICEAPDPFCAECLCLHLKTSHQNVNLTHISSEVNEKLQELQDSSKEKKESRQF